MFLFWKYKYGIENKMGKPSRFKMELCFITNAVLRTNLPLFVVMKNRQQKGHYINVNDTFI